jgi:RecB family exonuclease
VRSLATLSASSIDSYDQCPLRYKIEREWKIPGELSAATQFGAAIHTVMRAYYEAIKAGKRLGLNAVLECFQDAIRSAKIDDPHQLRLYTEQGVRQLTAFVEARADQSAPEVLATEKPFEFEIGGVRVIGRIDRIDKVSAKGVAIEDYKTGSPKDEPTAKKSMQLTIYAMAAKSMGLSAEKLTFYNLEGNTTVSTERSSDQLARAEEKIAEIAAGIRSGEFDPKPGYHCSWCAYSSICPAKEEKLFQISRAAGSIQ